MASQLETSQHKGSDLVYDVCCSVCEHDGIHKEGLFNCQKCSKYFCESCILLHNKLLRDHTVTEKGGGDWHITKQGCDTLELCEEHTTEKLKMFCEDHEKLLCHVCHLHNHRQCSKVVLLADKIKSTAVRLGVDQMTANIEQLQKRLEDMMKRRQQNITSLQTSYERVLEEILDIRRQINDNLDRVQQNTLRKLENIHMSLKSSFENDTKQCVEFLSKLKSGGPVDGGNTSCERSFITFRKCLEQSSAADSLLQELSQNDDVDIVFQHNNDLEQFLSVCTDLGKITSRIVVSHQNVYPNKVVSIQDKSQYNVRTTTDKYNCCITGICETSNRELIITDYSNQCVKLLDQAYNLIEQIKLPSWPWSICKISSNDVAVTVCSVNEIHLLRVDNGKIVKLTDLQLNHTCYGIAHHQDDLFVTSGTAVYHYRTVGRLVKKLYQITSPSVAVLGVAVKPDGKMIYVTDRYNGKLVTLTRDGAVTATLQDSAFKCSYLACNLHVAGTGQVLVFGNKSISQVDTEGKKILNTIDVDISMPGSVYFNEGTSKLLVGLWNNDNINEFKTKIS